MDLIYKDVANQLHKVEEVFVPCWHANIQRVIHQLHHVELGMITVLPKPLLYLGVLSGITKSERVDDMVQSEGFVCTWKLLK